MELLDKSHPVLVTGGSGYIASWLCKYLMEEGYHVRATFRDRENIAKYEHLQTIQDHTPGTLEIWEADLLDPTSFENVMEGCQVVFHVASPFIIFGAKDPENTLVKPAVEGTRTVLEAATRSRTVRRVVLTSSVVAMLGDNKDLQSYPNHTVTKDSWNTTSTLAHQPYNYSKTLAEREAWRFAEGQSWDLVVMNPGMVLGPSLSQRTDGASVDFMLRMLSGKFSVGVPDNHLGMVDVRDVAKGHILAAKNPQAKGRYILVGHHTNFLEIAQTLAQKYPKAPLPKRLVPKWLFSMVGPMYGASRKYVRQNIGYPVAFDAKPSQIELGLAYRPLAETLYDMADQLAADELW